MVYIRKTKDEYNVQCDYGYGYGYETVYTAETYEEAKSIYKDYKENDTFAIGLRIKKCRVKL